MGINDQINAVVEAREKAKEATKQRVESYQGWERANSLLIDNEKVAKEAREEAEAVLRDMAIVAYTVTGDKQVAPGVGIRVLTKLGYGVKEALAWAIEHKLAIKLDTSAFEKIAKDNNLPFVTITEEPQATIATELAKVS